MKLQRKYRKLRNMRDDIHDKVSTAIAKRYDTIVLEELSLQGMLQNQHLLKSLLDVFFYGFRQKLEWKVHKHRKNLIKIGRFDPSSKLWSKCGNIKRDLKLSDRIYSCDRCGLVIDWGYNASRNIRGIGLVKVVQSKFTPVKISTPGLHGIYPYRQMSVVEAGSSEASAEE